MTDQKPGCIHPGDKDGCLGNTFIGLAVAAVVGVGVVRFARFFNELLKVEKPL